MAFQFFDSSSLVKKYIGETGTNWVRNIFNIVPTQEIYVSRITEVEVTAAITRRRKGGSLSASDAALALQQLRSDFLVRLYFGRCGSCRHPSLCDCRNPHFARI